MSPEGKKILIQVLKELIKFIEVPGNMSDFISSSIAERDGDTWTFYIDSNNMTGGIPGCEGNSEYEVKENMWNLISLCKTL